MRTNRQAVVHVSSVHPWSDNRIHYRECVSLTEAGFEVTLIAADSGVQAPLTAVKLLRLRRRRRLARMVLSSTFAIRLALRTRARFVHLHDPELIPFIPLLRLAGRTVIYDAHEDLPAQVMDKIYLPRVLLPVAVVLAEILVRTARMSHHVVCATETIAQRYPCRKTTVIHNYPPLRREEDAADTCPASDREPAVVYVGGISIGRGAQVMVDAMGEAAIPDGWRLVVAGSGSEPLLQELKSQPAWSRVDFRGQVAPDEARRLILQSRIGLVLFADTKAHRDALPTKMFEYFAAGTPVIASDFTLWGTIVQENNCGVLVDPTSPAQVASAILHYAENPHLLDEHSKNARRIARENLNWSREAAILISVYRRIGESGIRWDKLSGFPRTMVCRFIPFRHRDLG